MGTLKLNKNLIKETEAVKAAEDFEDTELSKVAPCENDGAEIIRFAHADGGYIEEIKALRGPNQVVYRRNDGTCRKVISGTPQFYSDGEGNLKEIKSSLTDTGSSIENQANSFKLNFNKDGSNSKIFDLQKDGKVLTLSVAKSAKAHACGCTCELCKDGDNKVRATLADGTEVEYVSLNDRVKENIIIRERQERYEYDFTLNIGDLEVEEGTHNDLLLKDRQTGETEFRIPAPYMFDANNKRSDKVSYEMDVNGGELAIKVIADAEFINAADRAFPITIDPQIVANKQAINLKLYTEYPVYDEEQGWTKRDEWDFSVDISYFASDDYKHGKIEYDIPQSYVDGTVTNVIIRLQCIDCNGTVSINNKICTPQKGEYIDVECGPNLKNEFTIYGSGNSVMSATFYFISATVCYVANDAVNPQIKEYDLSGGVKGCLDVDSGALSTVIPLMNGEDFSVPLNIFQNHKVGMEAESCGLNWRLNLNKKLIIADDDLESNTKYCFKDEYGNVKTFNELYYYNDGDAKVFIDKSSVTLNNDGSLTCGNDTVHTYQQCDGYTLIPEVNDYVNVDLFEQRQDEQIQLEEYISQMELNFKSYVKVSTINGIYLRIDNITYSNYESIIDNIHFNAYTLMTEDNANRFRSIYLNKLSVEEQIEKLNKEIAEQTKEQEKAIEVLHDEKSTEALKKKYTWDYYYSVTKQIDSLNDMLSYATDQKALANQQMALLVEQADRNIPFVKAAYAKYFLKQAELERLLQQIPVNFLRDENGVIEGYNKFGDLILIADSYGNYVNIEYNVKNQIKIITDNNGKAIRFDYDNGLLCSITDNRGRQTKYEYEGEKLSAVKFADGKSLSFKYSSGYMRSVTDGYGIQTTFTRDSARNKFTKITTKSIVGSSDTLSTVSITYDESGTTFSYLDGSEERCKIDDNNRITLSYTKDPAGVTVTKEYSYENLTNGGRKVTCIERSNVKAEALTTVEEYDTLSRLIKKETPWHELTATMDIQNSSIYEYDRNNNLISECAIIEFKDNADDTNEYVKYKKYSYNAQGSLVLTESYVEGEEQTSGINFEERVYNDDGNMVKCIRWNSLDSSSKFYEECDRAENGQLKADRGETGEISAEYEYVAGTDIVNSVKLPDGSKFAYGRNPKNFEVTSITHSTADGEANTTEIEYYRGLPEKVKSGDTEIIYNYDTAGRKIAVLVNGVRQYSAKYALKTVYDTESETVSYGYYTETYHDTDGDITFKTEKSGRIDEDTGAYKVTERTYANKELVREISRNGCQEISCVKNGNLVSSYFRDWDNVLTDVKTYLNGALQLTESFVYNDYGEVTQKAITIGEATQTYSYAYKDNAARELESISVEGYTFKPLSDVNGRNTGREIYSGENKVAAEYITYRKVGDHATNMPATVWFGSGEKVTDSIKYKYDSCGNICEIRENGHIVAKYTYDSLNRIVREDNRYSGTTFLFTYDQNGNITERCEYPYTLKSGEELEELKCTHYSYDYEGDKLKEYNGEAFVYNNLGCPTTYRGKPATWIYGKLLASYNGVQFTYNGLGSRASKGGITFTYDSDGRLIKQSNGLEFIYDNSGVAGVIYANETYFYRKDAQGNIVAILTDSGAVVVKYVYDAWGNNIALNANGAEITSGIGVLNPFRYRGYYYDTETELYYLQTRYYDPELGRFISQDSLEYADPETINGLNLYAYCGDNPVMNVDNNGTVFLSFLLGLAIAAAIGVTAGAVAGGISAAVNHENILTGIWKGAIIGGLMGLSIGLVASGLGAPLAGTIWGSVAVAAGVGSAFALGVNIISQLENGSFNSLDIGQSFKSWGVGLVVGALAGGLSYATTEICKYYGSMLGLSLSSKTFLGVTISKIISKNFLIATGAFIGGGLGGLLGGTFVNYIATDSKMQERNVPLWIGTLLKFLFRK